MPFTSIGNRGTALSSANNQASLPLAVNANVVVGRILVVAVAVDNITTTNAAVTTSTAQTQGVTDAAGNIYEFLGGYAHGGGGIAQNGAEITLWATKATTQLNSGANVTATFRTSASADAAAMTAWEFSAAANATFALDQSAGSAATAAAPGSLTVTTANLERLRIRATASEHNSGTNWTPTTNWTAMTAAVSGAGTTATEMAVRGEFRISTTTSDASNPSSPGSVDHASIYVALQEVITITFSGLTVASPTIDTFVVTGVQAIALGGFTAASLTIPTYVAGPEQFVHISYVAFEYATSGSSTIVFAGLTVATPSMPTLVLTGQQTIALVGLTVASPSMPAFVTALEQRVIVSFVEFSYASLEATIVLSGLTVASPTIPAPAITLFTQLTFSGLTVASPSLPTLAVVQAQVVVFSGVTVASPSMPQVVITQVHAASFSGLITGPPYFSTPLAISPLVFLYPDSDVAVGGWTNESGGLPLWSSINEATINLNTYAQSVQDPVNDTFKVSLNDPIFTLSDPEVVEYVIGRKFNNATNIDLTVRLLQGTTEIASWLHTSIPYTPTLYEQTLDAGQRAAITNPAALHLEIKANRP